MTGRIVLLDVLENETDAEAIQRAFGPTGKPAGARVILIFNSPDVDVIGPERG